MNEKISAEKKILAEKKARLEKKEKLLNEKERKLRIKKIIKLGTLLEKANLDQLQDTVLFGALLEIQEKSKTKNALTMWETTGKAALNATLPSSGEQLAISFSLSPSEDILKLLREKSFKWNRFRKEWYGYGNKNEMEELLSASSPIISVLT